MAPKVAAAPHAKKMVGLPVLVASPVDLGRLIRELDNLSDDIHQATLRHKGKELQAPNVSKLMDKTLELNKLDIMNEADRNMLQEFLVATKTKAPVMHISFSADPSPAFMEKLLTWLRQEIHPLVLVTVGLQPNLGAGCVVRTTNKHFDLSLKQDFINKRELLMQSIREKVVAVAAPTEVVA